MRVTLTKRLGQNKPGTIIDTTITQARWMFERGVAEAAPEVEQREHASSAEQPTGAGQQAIDDDTSGDTPKTGRSRRAGKTISAAKPAGDEQVSGLRSSHSP